MVELDIIPEEERSTFTATMSSKMKKSSSDSIISALCQDATVPQSQPQATSVEHDRRNLRLKFQAMTNSTSGRMIPNDLQVEELTQLPPIQHDRRNLRKKFKALKKTTVATGEKGEAPNNSDADDLEQALPRVSSLEPLQKSLTSYHDQYQKNSTTTTHTTRTRAQLSSITANFVRTQHKRWVRHLDHPIVVAKQQHGQEKVALLELEEEEESSIPPTTTNVPCIPTTSFGSSSSLGIARRQHRHFNNNNNNRVRRLMMVLVGVTACLGAAYYLESINVHTYVQYYLNTSAEEFMKLRRVAAASILEAQSKTPTRAERILASPTTTNAAAYEELQQLLQQPDSNPH